MMYVVQPGNEFGNKSLDDEETRVFFEFEEAAEYYDALHFDDECIAAGLYSFNGEKFVCEHSFCDG